MSQPSGQKQDTRLALRHNYPAGSTVLVTSSSCFTSQPSGQKQDTRLALRHSYPAGSTVLVTSSSCFTSQPLGRKQGTCPALCHNHQVGSKRCLITTTTPPFGEGPFRLYQAYLESAQTLHEIEAWSTHQQPVHSC
jgi:hypothetical protein